MKGMPMNYLKGFNGNSNKISINFNWLQRVLLLGFLFLNSATAAIVSVFPRPLASVSPIDLIITVNFDEPVTPATVVLGKSFLPMGSFAGVLKGTLAFSNNNQTLVMTVTSPVSAGEVISVNLSKTISAANSGLRFWEFRTRTRAVSDFKLEKVATIAVAQTADEQGKLRTYGAFAGDLNQDGWHDITVITEFGLDVRIYMSDKNGGYVEPPKIVKITNAATETPNPSPNEGGDFNLDGFLDLAVAQTNGSAISILLGDGTGNLVEDGIYPVGGSLPVGRGTKGICALDLNGDNYYDIVATNRAGDNISIFINKGDGTFEDAVNMEGGVNAETSCASGDFNGDGLEDVAVGGFGLLSDGSDGNIVVLLSDGEGNLTVNASSTQDCNTPWMIVTGDFNNDGNIDVVTDNSYAREFSYYQGNGAGGLAAGVAYPTGGNDDGFAGALAIDAGDLDGDGNLDVVTSNYGSADWTLYMGVGDGTFGDRQEMSAEIAGSDALLHDRDGDGDLDFTGIDEEFDAILFFENTGTLLGVETPQTSPDALFSVFQVDTRLGILRFELEQPVEMTLEILSANGTVLMEAQPLNFAGGVQSLALPQLPAGIHYYRVKTPDRSLVKKLVQLN